MRGLPRTLSNSSSLRVIGNCWMLNESAPAWLRIACFTEAFSPWMSDTTAMIDVTATMLPSTVMKDRSLAAQIASSAMSADSAKLRMGLAGLPGLLRIVHLHRIAVGHAAHGVVGPRDDLIGRLQARQHLEILVARDPHLDRHELGAAVADDEDALHLLPRLPGLQFRRRRDRLHAAAAAAARPPPLVGARLTYDLPVRVVDELAHGDRRNRHRDDALARGRSDVRRAR